MVESMPMASLADPRAPAPAPLGWFSLVALAGLLLAATSPAATSPAATQEPDSARIATAVDSIVADALADGRAAGMSVAVVRGGDTIVLKGYGYAEMEFEVPTPDRAIYEIGSVTKQFTAAAVLLLQEEGKLSLDDDLTDHLPDYPTEGHHIPLRRLLDHTSGIKGYTEIPEFRELSIRKLPRDSLVALFSSRPFDFAPGEAMIYNNSAYFLLGLVIEEASGLTYEEYVQRKLFDRAGMTDSRYCDERAVVKRRAHGYEMGPDGLRRAAYLDHTWPYAAGSLCSTAWDLVAWKQALHGGRILSYESYRELIAPDTLNDGTRLRYAGGLIVDSLAGERVIGHGGGINGFLTDLNYFPDHDLTIAVLINTTGAVAPAAVTRGIAEAIFGPWSPEAVPLAAGPEAYAGEYRGPGRGGELVLTVKPDLLGTGLNLRRGDRPASGLTHLGGEVFARNRQRLTFLREWDRVVAVRAEFPGMNTVLRRQP